ncbi:PLP-dependent aminotransferase family protein [soil metagenome]
MKIGSFEFAPDHKSALPIVRQLSNGLRKAIIAGQIEPNTVLPSVREIASQLFISRSTAARAIEELAAQGYVVSELGSGTRVAAILPGEMFDRAATTLHQVVERPPQLSEFGKYCSLAAGTISEGPRNYPILSESPIKTFRELLLAEFRLSHADLKEYKPDPFGYPPLREAVASYLIRARAVKVTKERLIIFSSRNLRVDLIANLLLDPGELVVVEEPGFFFARNQFITAGCKIMPIPVDSEGLQVDKLSAVKEKIKLIYVTPSHQEPTGAVLSIARRRQLLDFAKHNGAYIIEDDYDSEYRYNGRPFPSLQGMDNGSNIIHLSCFWQVLGPISRLSFMVIPELLVEPFKAAKNLVEKDVSYIEQAALSEFINQGHLQKLIRKQKTRLAARRKILVVALQQSFRDRVYIAPESAGLNLLVRFDNSFSPRLIAMAATASGLNIDDTAVHYFRQPRSLEYTIFFSSMSVNELTIRVNLFTEFLLSKMN